MRTHNLPADFTNSIERSTEEGTQTGQTIARNEDRGLQFTIQLAANNTFAYAGEDSSHSNQVPTLVRDLKAQERRSRLLKLIYRSCKDNRGHLGVLSADAPESTPSTLQKKVDLLSTQERSRYTIGSARAEGLPRLTTPTRLRKPMLDPPHGIGSYDRQERRSRLWAKREKQNRLRAQDNRSELKPQSQQLNAYVQFAARVIQRQCPIREDSKIISDKLYADIRAKLKLGSLRTHQSALRPSLQRASRLASKSALRTMPKDPACSGCEGVLGSARKDELPAFRGLPRHSLDLVSTDSKTHISIILPASKRSISLAH